MSDDTPEARIRAMAARAARGEVSDERAQFFLDTADTEPDMPAPLLVLPTWERDVRVCRSTSTHCTPVQAQAKDRIMSRPKR